MKRIALALLLFTTFGRSHVRSATSQDPTHPSKHPPRAAPTTHI